MFKKINGTPAGSDSVAAEIGQSSQIGYCDVGGNPDTMRRCWRQFGNVLKDQNGRYAIIDTEMKGISCNVEEPMFKLFDHGDTWLPTHPSPYYYAARFCYLNPELCFFGGACKLITLDVELDQ